MNTIARSERFVERHLDPSSRLGEVLFGLIMVLCATLTAGLTADSGPDGVRELLYAAIGCNIAWGLIDAVMYLMNCVTDRAEKARLVRAVQSAPDSDAALAIVRSDIEPLFETLTSPDQREALSRSIFEYLLHSAPPRASLTGDDLRGALACFWLVFLACLPAAAPFLVFSDPTVALRISNFLLIAMLFLVGNRWALYAHTNRLVAGLAMVAIGLALVWAAVLLGG